MKKHFATFIKDILLALGILLILCGTVTLMFSNFSASNPLLVCMGLVLASFRFLPENKFTKIYTALAACGFAAFFAVIAVIVLLKPSPADGTEDAVVVLGCAVIDDRPSNTMVARTDAAYRYYLKNPDALFVLSGGMGAQESISEAEAMKRLMMEYGVPESQLIKEEQATSTSENFIYSKKILDTCFDGEYRTAFVTNDFHCYRAGRLAKIHGLDNAGSIAAMTPKNAVLLCYVREVLAVIKMWILKS